MQHQPHDLQELRRRFVEGRDVPCPSCNYNLRNTTSDRCPECGELLRLRINVPRTHRRAWLAAMLAGSIPFGFHLTITCIAAWAWHQRRDSSRWFAVSLSEYDLQVMRVVAISLAAYGIALVVMSLLHGFMSRQSFFVRWLIALVWSAALLGSHAWVVLRFIEQF